MQELEKILEEIEEEQRSYEADHAWNYAKGLEHAANIIRKHMNDGKDNNVLSNDGWIPVDKELPPNAKHKGALCPRYQVMTKYGVTEGWYNPDRESWYVLIWFMGNDHLESEIDFEHGDVPKILRLPDNVNNVEHILTAWKPLEPYRPERRNNV